VQENGSPTALRRQKLEGHPSAPLALSVDGKAGLVDLGCSSMKADGTRILHRGKRKYMSKAEKGPPKGCRTVEQASPT